MPFKIPHKLYLLLTLIISMTGISCSKRSSDNPPTTQEVVTDIQVLTNQPLLTNKLMLGVTYMQYNLTNGGDPTSIERGKDLLKGLVVFHNQHIFGFGAGNIEPKKGIYDWSTLDNRIQLMRDLGATPVITLATAPTWMTDSTWTPGKYANETDWSKIEYAPLPEHVQDFADLCAQVAKRYPDVKYFQVWNEMKGLWNPTKNRWDYERFTTLYNKVYEAVKSIRPDAMLGGPYVVLNTYLKPNSTQSSSISSPLYGTVDKRDLDVITYWLNNKSGADFICVDGNVKTRDVSDLNIINATKKFYDISIWIHNQTTLPVWWAEDYVGQSPPVKSDTAKQAAAIASMLAYHALAGDAASLRWSPERQPSAAEDDFITSLFTSTLKPGGGRPLPNYNVYRDFHRFFPAGTTLAQTGATSDKIRVLASAKNIMLINTTDSTQAVNINHAKPLTLQPYQVYFGDIP